MAEDDQGIRGRVTRQGEEALGRIAEELVGNPLVAGALARAFEARERAVQAQEVAMGALNIPSAADIERLTRRLRSVSQRLEGIEDAVDRLDERLASIEGGVGGLDGQLADIAQAVEKVGGLDGQLGELSQAVEKVGGLDARLADLVKAAGKSGGGGGGRTTKADRERTAALEERLEELARDIGALRTALAPADEPPPRAQERLTVTEP